MKRPQDSHPGLRPPARSRLLSRPVLGWALYDWANSAFATTVMAGFFPLFFKQYWSAGVDANLSTAQLGLANSAAGLVVALLAPVLGAMADAGGGRKRFLVLFAYLGVLMTACLWLVGKGQWEYAALCYALGNVGFAGSNIFYDALLPAVAPEDRLHLVSGLGFAAGYLGGGLLFALNVAMVLKPALFGLADAALAVRVSFLSVALWWGGFTIFTLAWVPAPDKARWVGLGPALRGGMRRLGATLRQARRLREVMLFLAAYWFYIDGVDTIIRMAVDYGMSLGFQPNHLIVALLIVQFVGFPAALVFGRLGQNWSVRGAIFITRAWHFYLLAVVIGCVQGGIQALSRSFYACIIPPGQAGEFFGFYNMLGKFAAILGPVLMGGAGLLAREILMPPGATADQALGVERLATRISIAAVLILFLAGISLFSRVDEARGRAQAQALAGEA